MRFKAGDRVIVARRHKSFNAEHLMDKWIGEVMTVRDAFGNGYFMKEDAGEGFCCGGWLWHEDCLEPVKPETIVIYCKGSEVIALDMFTGKKAAAKCHPADTFNFKVGAELAFDRLLGKKKPFAEPVKPKPQYYNGKVVCVDLCGCNENHYTVGKVYQFNDGVLTADSGELISDTSPFSSFEQFSDFTSSKFIEIVE